MGCRAPARHDYQLARLRRRQAGIGASHFALAETARRILPKVIKADPLKAPSLAMPEVKQAVLTGPSPAEATEKAFTRIRARNAEIAGKVVLSDAPDLKRAKAALSPVRRGLGRVGRFFKALVGKGPKALNKPSRPSKGR